jgi:hypothetical protein
VADRYPQLASHEQNVEYYSTATTEQLERWLPQAKVDVECTARRLAAIEAVLKERRD